MKNLIDKYISTVAGQQLNSENILTNDEKQRIFYILTRQEEIDNPIRNKWGNWRFSYTKENYTEPYLDNFVTDILNKKGIQKKSIWPDNKKYAAWLTHDVDAVTQISSKLDYRFLKRRNKINLKNFIKRIIEIKKNDPLWHFEDWLKIEEQYGFKSTFFFFVMPYEKNIWIRDCLYTPDDVINFEGKKMKVKEMIKEIHKAGWEIGLHASYNTYDNVELLKQQKNTLENIIGDEVKAVRQHYLHYDVAKTPRVHHQVGFKIDSTQGFARTLGFRAGTGFSYFTYDHLKKEILDTLELPMIIMDDPLFNDDGLELYGEYALKKCMELSKQIETTGGILTVNFHANHINIKDWFEVYSNYLTYLKNSNCSVLTSCQILDFI